MNSIKCRNCGLTNFSIETECRRCGDSFLEPTTQKRADKPPRRFSIFPWIFIAIAVGVGYYFYTGVQDNVVQINASEANRLAEQKKDPTAGLTRSQYEKHRTGTYGNAMSNNPSFQAQRKHDEETQKVMQAVSNSGAQ